jgi:hypothetical protein
MASTSKSKGDSMLGCPKCPWNSDPFFGKNDLGGWAGIAMDQYKDHFMRNHVDTPLWVNIVQLTRRDPID